MLADSDHRTETIGPYQVLAEMGRGGTGVVCKCRHNAHGGLAAVKTPHDTSRLQRDFLRKEIAMLRRLGRSVNHGVVRLLDSAEHGPLPWYAMEFVEGPSLFVVLQDTWHAHSPFRLSDSQTENSTLPATDSSSDEGAPLSGGDPPVAIGGGLPHYQEGALRFERLLPIAAAGKLERSLRLLREVARALAFVHGAGIVHGDLNPRNILLDAAGQPVLVDFGTSIYASSGDSSREVAQVEGLRHGTLGYMAPEQLLRQPLDARCDLYALGCLLYEFVCGRAPFVAGHSAALVDKHLHDDPPPPSNWVTGIPAALEELILTLLAKDRRARIGYAADVARLLEEISSASLEPTFASSPAPPHLYRSRLVGRRDALERLTSGLSEASAGVGSALFVAGESGVGKTRLTNELGSRATTERFEVIVAQCRELPQRGGMAVPPPPLHPLRPMLQKLADRCHMAADGTVSESLAEAIAVLTPYEPALESVLEPRRVSVPELPPGPARARVFRSVTEVVHALSRERPLLVVLDDLQWADDLTFGLLGSSFVAQLRQVPILLVGSYRNEVIPEPIVRMREAKPEAHLALGRLSIEAVREMVKDMMATSLAPDGLVNHLYQRSEGNPFFVAEHLSAAIAHGRLYRESGDHWQWMPSRGLRDAELPASLQDLLALRLESLSAEGAEAFDLASILGREFHGDLLGAITSPASEVSGMAETLDVLVARHLLEYAGDGRFRFTHDAFREARERSLPEPRRRQLHRLAAARLEMSISAGSSEPQDAALGSHWAQADEPARAFECLERAAQRAQSVYATAEAVDLYRLAFAQAHKVVTTGDEDFRTHAIRVGEAWGDLLMLLARHDEAVDAYERALVLTPPGSHLTRARFHRKKAKSFWTVHQYPEAAESLDAAERDLGALEQLTTGEGRSEWIEIRQSRFWLLYFARRTGSETATLIEKMKAAVAEFGTPMQRARFFQCAANDLLGRGCYRFSPQSVSLNRQAVEELARLPAALHEVAQARFQLAFALLLGDQAAVKEALGLLETTSDDVQRIGDATLLSRALIYEAVGFRRLNDVERARAAAQRAYGAAEIASLHPYLGASAACLGWVAWRSGQYEAARKRFTEAHSWWRSSEHQFPFRWLAGFPLLDIHVSCNDLAGVAAILDDLLGDQQQRFPAPLDEALVAARVAVGSETGTRMALRRVLELAQDFNYL